MALKDSIAVMANQCKDAGARAAIIQLGNAFMAELNAIKALYNAHTHKQSATDNTFTSAPCTDAAGKTQGTASAYTPTVTK
jgi:hypothetical protein